MDTKNPPRVGVTQATSREAAKAAALAFWGSKR